MFNTDRRPLMGGEQGVGLKQEPDRHASGGSPDVVHICFYSAALSRSAMPLPLAPANDAAGLRALAHDSKHANQTRRLLTLATIYDGAARTETAVIGGSTV